MSSSATGPDGNDNNIVFHELTAVPRDIDLLRQFYQDLYLPEVHDPGKHASLDNMMHFLELKMQGWYGANNYHIVLLIESGRPVAGSVSEYLSDANAGIIEFLAVALPWRRQGLGTRLLRWTENTLAVDAGSHSERSLRAIVAAMHDPRTPDRYQVSLESLTQARIWGGWGYRKLNFDYLQPALSEHRQAAPQLILIAKVPGDGTPHTALGVQLLRAILREYLYWAMRIEEPERTVEYQQMCAQLTDGGYVDLLPLEEYLQSGGSES